MQLSMNTSAFLAANQHGPEATCFEVTLARRPYLKLAWEDAWNHGRMQLSVTWLSHRSVRP